MSAELGSLVVSLSADLARFESDLGRANHLAEQNARSMERAFEGVRDLFKGMATAEFVREMVGAAKEAEQAEARLDTVLKATGMAAGLTSEELNKLADATAANTQFTDEAARNAEAQLLKFGNVQEDVFRRALKLSGDYAAFMGTDLVAATQLVGSALASPAEAAGRLERQIGKLTLAQKDSIKHYVDQNDMIGAQNALLDILEKKIGGAADAMNTGYTRSTGDAKKSWDEFLEALGRSQPIIWAVEGALGAVEMTLNGLKAGVNVISGIVNSLNYTSSYKDPNKPDERPQANAAAIAARLQAEQDAAQLAQRKLIEKLDKDRAAAAAKAAAEQAREQKALLAKGVASEEAAAKARYDAANQAYIDEGQRGLARIRALKAEEAAMQSMAEGYLDMIDPMRAYARQLDQIVTLQTRGFLDSAQAFEAYDKVLTRQMEESQKKFGNFKQNGKEAVDEIVKAVEGWGRTTSKELAKMVTESKFSFGNIRQSAFNLLQDIIAMQINKRMVQPIIAAGSGILDKAFGKLDGLFGGSDANAAADEQYAMMARVPVLGSNANGADYIRQTGPYLLHQGEQVVSSAANDGRNGGGTYYIDARGADREGMARLEARITALNGSIEHRAVAAVSREARSNRRFNTMMAGA